MKTRTSSAAHQKAVGDAAKAKYTGNYTKVEGMCRCAGKCKRLLPFDSFDLKPGGRIRQNWCRDCRASWGEAGLPVTYTAKPLRIGS